MRLSVVTFMRPGNEPRGRPLGRIVDYARQIEKRGFPGIWVTDSLGRGRPTLDPLVALGALSVATQRVELGTAVLQVSLRHPIELAHRVQSVQALSGGRLRLGVGSGSTRADFDLLGADYDQRFRTLMRSLEIMRRAWSGEPVNGGMLSPWPGCEGGPPVLLGAWRNPRWIAYAARQCAGRIASGLYSSWEDLEAGMRLYREAGGKNAGQRAGRSQQHTRTGEPRRAGDDLAGLLAGRGAGAVETDRSAGLRRGSRRLARRRARRARAGPRLSLTE
jgi:alkanesulfonate monooxygenase SsuD/methylene tetrahydromethanopterin reductase-like flavin-dependent oxidoreductase (luciferase family)